MNLDTATIPELTEAIAGGALTPVELTERYLSRIAELDDLIGAVLTLVDDPLAAAAAAQPGPLHGIPLLVKDNIDVAGLPTTAGSRALTGNTSTVDAPLVALLRAAGAVVLGKSNLSEWANFRDGRSTSGWSAVGGQTRNPHVLDRSPSGSSSGSAAAVAAALCQVAIGTETDGSITSPAGVCGVVALKPTHGSVPGERIVPISRHQDVAGPFGRHVVDVAITHAVLTAGAPLRRQSLRGKRFGLWREPDDGTVSPVLDATAETLRAAGAQVVEVELAYQAEMSEHELAALLGEFRHDLQEYLRGRTGCPNTLAELIAFNENDPEELAHFGQGLFRRALDAADPAPHRELARLHARAALDEVLDGNRLDALLTPTNGPACRIDYRVGDLDVLDSAGPAAVAGYPAVTVPAGFAGVLPLGVSLIGRAGTDRDVLALASAFEQATAARGTPRLLATAPD